MKSDWDSVTAYNIMTPQCLKPHGKTILAKNLKVKKSCFGCFLYIKNAMVCSVFFAQMYISCVIPWWTTSMTHRPNSPPRSALPLFSAAQMHFSLLRHWTRQYHYVLWYIVFITSNLKLIPLHLIKSRFSSEKWGIWNSSPQGKLYTIFYKITHT